MKGKINKYGELHIERAGVWRVMICPHKSTSCTERCPLFGEPSTQTMKIAAVDGEFTDVYGETLLEICNNRLFRFDEFTDEREVQDEN